MNCYITNTAMISAFGHSLEDYCRGKLCNEFSSSLTAAVIPTDDVKLPKSRRIDRYTKISGMSALSCLAQQNLDYKKDDVGLVVTSSYGPEVSNSKFIDELFELGFGLASSGVFSYVVANANAGYISRALDNNGPIITQQGSNALKTAMNMLYSGNSNMALVVAVDELTDSLRKHYQQSGFNTNNDFQDPDSVTLSEVSNALLLKTKSALLPEDQILGEVMDTRILPVRLHSHLRLEAEDYLAKLAISILELLTSHQLKLSDVGLVSMAHHSSELLYTAEKNVLLDLFDSNACIINPKNILGFTNGSSLQNAICLALEINENSIFETAIVHGELNNKAYVLLVDVNYNLPGFSVSLIRKGEK